MSTWTFQNPSKKPHPGKNLSVSMRQNSKEALSPSIGVYIKAPVTSVGNRAANELNWIETPNSYSLDSPSYVSVAWEALSRESKVGYIFDAL